MDMNGPIDGFKTIVYVGKSMYPLLRDLDFLYYIPYTGQRLKIGDVIVFMPAGRQGKTNVTHRVISICPNGVVTKGDNNNSPDDGVLTSKEIIGLVVYAKRGNRFIKIHGGMLGRLFSYMVRVYLSLRPLAMKPMVWPYHVVSKSGICRVFVPRSMKPRVISYKQSDHIESKLLMGKRVIGRFKPGDKKWIIYPPYKLFVNEATLPVNVI